MSVLPAAYGEYDPGAFPPAYEDERGDIPVAVERYITTFNGDGRIDVPKLLAVGDFRFKVRLKIPDESGAGVRSVVGGSRTAANENRFAIFFNTSNNLLIEARDNSGGVFFITLVSSVTINKYASQIVDITVGRLGTSLICEIENQSIVKNAGDVWPIAIERIGAFGSSLEYTDEILEADFISGFTQDGNIDGNPKYILDTDLSTPVIVNKNNPGAGDATAVQLFESDASLYQLNQNTFFSEWINQNQTLVNAYGRFFISFNQASGQRLSLSPQVSVRSQLYASFDVTVDGSPVAVLVGNNVNFYIGTDEGKVLVGNGSDRSVVGDVINDGRLHKIEALIDDSSFIVKLNRVEIYNQPVAFSGQSIFNIGADSSNLNGWTGLVSNVIITSDNVNYVASSVDFARETSVVKNDSSSGVQVTSINQGTTESTLYQPNATGWETRSGVQLVRAY